MENFNRDLDVKKNQVGILVLRNMITKIKST